MIGFPNYYDALKNKVNRRREFGCAAGCLIICIGLFLFVEGYYQRAVDRAVLHAKQLYRRLQAGDFESPEVRALARDEVLAKFKQAEKEKGRVESFEVLYGGAQITGMPGFAHMKVTRRGKQSVEEVESTNNTQFDGVAFDLPAQ